MTAKTSPILYTVKGHAGAHLLLNVRKAESAEVADVQLIGAPLPFSVPVADVTPFDRSQGMTSGDPITLLAQEALTVYSLDPGRIQRAADLARDPYAVQNARFDELGEPIQPSLKVQCVKGGNGWYVVRPNFCQCPDNAKGHTCKHRIAAWMKRELTVRPLAQARKTTPARILAELTA